MVVKIRFGRGPVVTRRKGKNGRLASLAASLLTLVSLSCGSFALWRIGGDLDWAGDFVFRSGLLSHWQVWLGLALAVQYTSWRLARYGRNAGTQQREAEAAEESPAPASAVANV
jgi:hypothetical protein